MHLAKPPKEQSKSYKKTMFLNDSQQVRLKGYLDLKIEYPQMKITPQNYGKLA